MLNRTGHRVSYLLALMALAFGWPSGAKAEPPLVFTPTGKWTLTGDDGQCFLTRTFSDGADASTLRIDQFPLQYAFRVTVSFDHHHGGRMTVPAKIGFDGGAKTRRVASTEIFDEIGSIRRVYRTFLGPADLADAARSGLLIVIPAGNVGLQLSVSILADAVLALRRCEQL